MRYSINEISADRIYGAMQRRLNNIPSLLSWNIDRFLTKKNRRRLEKYRNIHRGERAVIVCNGPSLEKMDLSKLAGEITFGLNRIYLLFDESFSNTTYYVSINELVLGQFFKEIASLESTKFLSWHQRGLFEGQDSNTAFIHTKTNIFDSFCFDITRSVCSGGTVTFVALQIAYFMGFKEIVLIGMDHRFTSKGTPNRTEVRTADIDTDHFHPNYFPKGFRWQLPDLRRSEIAYGLTRRAFENDGRKILDATIDGKCNVFKKVDFARYF